MAKVERGVLKSASGGARKVASTAHGTSSCEEGEFAAHSYAAQLGYNVGCVLLQGRPVNTRRVGDSPRPPTYCTTVSEELAEKRYLGKMVSGVSGACPPYNTPPTQLTKLVKKAYFT